MGGEVKGMIRENNHAVKMTALAVALLLFTGFLRLVHSDGPLIDTVRAFLIFTIYIGMLASWGLSIRRRMMHSHIRSYLLGISGLMLFWVFVRTLKWYAFGYIDVTERFLWYCYYIPTIFIPLLSFFAALCLGKPESWRPRKGYHLLLIPAALLLLGILTNDMHQLAFAFMPDFENWSSVYTHRILYFLTAFWMVGFLAATVLLLFQKSHIPHTKKRVWLPLLVVMTGILYAILYSIDQSSYGAGFIEATAMYCALTAAIWESCIQTGLLPVNTQYAAFFDASHIAAQITDDQGKVYYSSRWAKPVPSELFQRLKQEGSLQSDADNVLHTAPIRGGHVVWHEDVSGLSRLIDELRIVGKELQEGVKFLQKEMEVKAKRHRIDEQNRLYELTVRQTMSHLERIKVCLAEAEGADDAQKRRYLREINMLGTYIKRRSNLILMAEGKEAVNLSDLIRCFEESFESLGQEDARCSLTATASGEINHVSAILLYDFFQEAMEAGFSSLQHLLVSLEEQEGNLVLLIEIECAESLSGFPDTHWRKEEIASLGGQISRHKSGEGRHHCALRLPKGGAPS